MTIDQQTKIVESYANKYGVPASCIQEMLKELNVNEDRFNENMRGQTAALIGGEVYTYPSDIIRFLKGLPVID